MGFSLRLSIVTFLSVIYLGLAAAFATAAPIPLKHFANLPDVSNVTLSPNGNKIVSKIRIDVGDRQGIAVQSQDLVTKEKKMLLFTDNTKYFISSIWWKDDTTLLVRTWYPSERDTWTGFSQARFKTRETRLLIINTETGEVTSPYTTAYLKQFTILPVNLSNVISSLPNDPNHILMSSASSERGFPSYPTVHKINIKNHSKTSAQRSKDRVYGWRTDQQSRVRLAIWRKDGRNATLVKNLKTNKWNKLWPYTDFSEDEVHVLGFDKDPNILYINAYHEKRMAVFKVDLRDKKLNRQLMYADEHYDVFGGLVYSPLTGEVIGIGGSGEEGTKFFTPKLKKLQASIDKALANTRNFIYSITDDENKYLVYSTGPTESGTYYMGQVKPPKLKAIAYRYNQLPPDALASVEKISYPARDGLSIEAYLTLPKGGGKNLPTLMFPHGGPFARDSLSFDYWAQFFANRGYAVLQMNFRGSEGQGLEFRNSGLKKWGKEMQDDIEDGALDLIKRGITDPNSVCIVGASYGGYAALMGVTKTPDRYKCAISVNGVSNVRELVTDNRSLWSSYNVVEEMIGDDLKELKQISPVYNAQKIKAPVLLIHGALDRQVPIKHSEQMHEALLKEKKDVTFVQQPMEDHYLSNEANRVEAFKLIEAFLAKHLLGNRTDKPSTSVLTH